LLRIELLNTRLPAPLETDATKKLHGSRPT
jgi:hypothetical protein